MTSAARATRVVKRRPPATLPPRGARAIVGAIPPHSPPVWTDAQGTAGTITAVPRSPPYDRVAYLPDGAERAIWLPLPLLEIQKE